MASRGVFKSGHPPFDCTLDGFAQMDEVCFITITFVLEALTLASAISYEQARQPFAVALSIQLSLARSLHWRMSFRMIGRSLLSIRRRHRMWACGNRLQWLGTQKVSGLSKEGQ